MRAWFRFPSVTVAGCALALAAPGAEAAQVTVGADLNRPANGTFTCASIPAGGWLMPSGATSCTHFTTAAGLFSTAESDIVPAGFGVITRIRVKTGPVTGPMQVVTFRSIKQSQSTGEPGCCWPQYATQTFTPGPNTITEIPTSLPVINVNLLAAYLPIPGSQLPSGPNTDPYGGIHEASTGIQAVENYDQIALSVLDATTPVPAQVDATDVSGGMFWPPLQTRDMRLLTLGQNGNGSATRGAHVLLQGTWEPDIDRDGLGDDTQDPQVVQPGTGAAGGGAQQADKAAPALKLKAPARTLGGLRSKGLRVTVTSDEACKATVRLLLSRTHAKRLGIVAAAKPVTVGKATASIPAGARSVTVKLTTKARKALRRAAKVKLTVEVRAKDAAGNTATKTLSRTFRR